MPLLFETSTLPSVAQQVANIVRWNSALHFGLTDIVIEQVCSKAPDLVEPSTSLVPVLVPSMPTAQETFSRMLQIFRHKYPLYRRPQSYDWDWDSAAKTDLSLARPHLRTPERHIPGLHWEVLEFSDLIESDAEGMYSVNAAHAGAFAAWLHGHDWLGGRDIVLAGYRQNGWHIQSLQDMYVPTLRTQPRRFMSMHVSRRLRNHLVPVVRTVVRVS